jgi:hypothetical protein
VDTTATSVRTGDRSITDLTVAPAAFAAGKSGRA